ncbi:MAG TPA: DUF3971 domain-containing protein, partial [Gammaproteobacteria bacterium]|nr:DUF3971 domain-containing protein [Gammaproteobacteria bacterium]
EDNQPLKGLLYIKARDQNLELFKNMLKQSPITVIGDLDLEMWNTVKGFEILQSTLRFDANKLHLKSPQEAYYIDSLRGSVVYNKEEGQNRYQLIAKDLDFGADPKTSLFLEAMDFDTFSLKGSNINLAFLHFLVNGTSLSESLTNLQVKPHGLIPYFEATIDKNFRVKDLLLEGENLGFVHPKLKAYGLDGKFFLTENTMQADLKGHNLFVPESTYFSQEFVIPSYQMHLVFDLYRQTIQLYNIFELPKGVIEQKLKVHVQNDVILSIDMHASTLSVEALKTFVPSKIFNPSLQLWLEKALKSGDFSDISFKYFGLAQDLEKKNTTPIRLKANVHNLTLDYAPPWPTLRQFEGQLSIDNHQLTMQGKGALPQGEVTNIAAIIPDLRAEPTNLQIEAVVKADLTYGWNVLKESTILANDVYKMFDFRGKSVATLNFNIPLTEDKNYKTQYNGTIHFDSATAQLSELHEPFQQMQGVINFQNELIKLENITTQWFNNPLQGNIMLTLGENPHLTIQSEGTLALKNQFENAFVKGDVPFTAAIDWYLKDQNFADAHIIADLTQVDSKLPEPFDRLKSKSPLKIQTYFKPKDQIKMQLSLATALKAALKFDLKPTTGMRFEAGHIHFGSEDPIELPIQGWKIDGVLDTIHLTDWLKLKNNFPTNPHLPIEFDLFVHTLGMQNNHFSKMNIQGAFAVNANKWQIQIHSPQLEASISLPLDPNKAWEFAVSNVILEKSFENKDQQEYPRRPLIFTIEKLQRPGMRIKDFSLQLFPN